MRPFSTVRRFWPCCSPSPARTPFSRSYREPISTVNLAEVLTKLIDRGMAPPMARAAVEATGIEVVPFDEDQALGASELRTLSRALGLSLGDRACLALAKARDAVALTADHAWATLPDLRVVAIR